LKIVLAFVLRSYIVSLVDGVEPKAEGGEMASEWRVMVWFATGNGYVVKSKYVSETEARRLARDWSDARGVRIEHVSGSFEQIKGTR
jgi:hypothetical protein